MYEQRKVSDNTLIFLIFQGMPRERWIEELTKPLSEGPGYEEHEAQSIASFMDGILADDVEGMPREDLIAHLEKMCAADTREQLVDLLVTLRRYSNRETTAPNASFNRMQAFMAQEGINFDNLRTWAVANMSAVTDGDDDASYRDAVLTSRVPELDHEGNPHSRVGEFVHTLEGLKDMCNRFLEDARQP